MRNDVLLIAGIAVALGCSSNSPSGSDNAGGTTSNGGSTAGGSSGSGAATGTGGSTSAGGVGSGGKISSGGAIGSGGRVGTGGDGPGSGGKVGGTGGLIHVDGGQGGKTGPVDAAAGTGGKTGGNTGAGGGKGTGGKGGGVDAGTTTGSCDRTSLQAAVDSYLAAIAAKDTSKMDLASSVKYTESTSAQSVDKSTALDQGLWQTALPVKFSRSLLDVTGCETFTEVFITEGSHPYVLGTHLALKDGQIAQIQVIVTDSDDWNFDATAFETCSESEDWSALPASDQSSRDTLTAAAQAYFDVFSDKSVAVPWGSPCYRLEGGKGCTPQGDKSSKSCNVGIPDGITFTKTHFVVDVDVGGVVGITLFSGIPDTHMFRIIDDKIVKIHTLTCTHGSS